MIHTRGLTRHFRLKNEMVEAVRSLDIDVEAGELVAFLGPNGAGKSTSLRMLTTVLPPTSGSAVVAGRDVRADPAGVRRRIGYLGQNNGAGSAFRVRDELVTQGRWQGLSRADARTRAGELMADMELTGLAKRSAGTLSGGQRRRLDIAMALVHRPSLLFLDEPTTGLDPQSRANLWEHILRLRGQTAATVFFTTHYLEEADQWADRVMIVDQGSVIADDTPGRLKTRLAGDRITITADCAADAARAAEIAGAMPGAAETERDDATVRVRTARGDVMLPELLRALDAAGLHARTADLQRPTLDDVFLTLTGRSLRETAQPADQPGPAIEGARP
ncbi:ATP-binding cassette domain-containing protein [Actinomadura sp. KC345]|uniref:ATP-binding cassette domain-containing protein n=1 Tax=Actinomadura sp. KC345 TaxID=2530371 RepID=UPI001043E8FC|nr:ATP-binding cassette domain-containing protein [Actinomadura sp. KC345]TDC54744.1 ATP-binding cassette domain-containing protein [Actinomadura sp. KC345]